MCYGADIRLYKCHGLLRSGYPSHVFFSRSAGSHSVERTAPNHGIFPRCTVAIIRVNDTVNRENDTVNRENDTVNRGNDTVNRGNDTVNRESDTVNRENDTVNRENDTDIRSKYQ